MKNVGQKDRITRSLLAVVITVLIFMGSISGVWLLVGISGSLLLVSTALTGLCPLYAFFHVSSAKKLAYEKTY